MSKYHVRAGTSPDDSDTLSGDFDTLKEAVKKAKYVLTEEYRRGSEMSIGHTWSGVYLAKTGELLEEFARR